MDAPRVSFKPEPRRFLGINPGFSRVAWERFVPFLQFPPPARRVLYTTHSIESLNAELRKATRNRHQFPNDTATLKTLWLMICTIEDKRAIQRPKKANRDIEYNGHIEGATVNCWKQAINQLARNLPRPIHGVYL